MNENFQMLQFWRIFFLIDILTNDIKQRKQLKRYNF